MCPMLPPVSSLEGSSNKCGALQDGYSACTIQKAVSPLLSKYCSKSSVLCSSDSWNSVWISWFHSCTLEVTRWISQNRPETSKGSPGVYMVLHQWQAVFLPNQFFSTCCLCTCNYFKIPSQLADPFHRLARKGSLGIFKGELRNVNRLELQSSAVCQRAVQPLIVQQVMCALLKKLI